MIVTGIQNITVFNFSSHQLNQCYECYKCCNHHILFTTFKSISVTIRISYKTPRKLFSCNGVTDWLNWETVMVLWHIYMYENIQHRMHCKMVFNFIVRHDHAFKSCQTRWPLIGLRNLILIGQLRIWWKQTKAFFHTHPRRCKLFKYRMLRH